MLDKLTWHLAEATHPMRMRWPASQVFFRFFGPSVRTNISPSLGIRERVSPSALASAIASAPTAIIKQRNTRAEGILETPNGGAMSTVNSGEVYW